MEFFSCELTCQSQLIDFPSEHVRWLDLQEDWPAIAAHYQRLGVTITQADFPVNQWKLCAWVEDGEICSMAGVMFMTIQNWEIGAVSTHSLYFGRGYAKAVCAFAARYILVHGKRVTCNTAADNLPMRRVMQAIGMMSQ